MHVFLLKMQYNSVMTIYVTKICEACDEGWVVRGEWWGASDEGTAMRVSREGWVMRGEPWGWVMRGARVSDDGLVMRGESWGVNDEGWVMRGEPWGWVMTGAWVSDDGSGVPFSLFIFFRFETNRNRNSFALFRETNKIFFASFHILSLRFVSLFRLL